MILHPSSFYCFMPKNTGKIYLKGLRHIEVEEILLVNQVSAEVETDIHAGLHFDADSGAEVGEHPSILPGLGPMNPHPPHATKPRWLTIFFTQLVLSVLNIWRYSAITT